MRRSGAKPWGGLAASMIISLELAPAGHAQNTGAAAGSASGSETSVTLPEVSVSAQPDRAFFAPDTASQGVVTGKEIEETLLRELSRSALGGHVDLLENHMAVDLITSN